MKLKHFILLCTLTALFLMALPSVSVGYFVWLDSLRERFAVAAYSLAESLGASGMTLDGSIVTLSNGEKVDVAFTCIDFISVIFVALSATVSIVLVLTLKDHKLTKLGLATILLSTFIIGIAINTIRIGVTLYLANSYYPSLVKSAGWQTFHDSVAFFIYTLYITFCTFLAYIFSKP